MDHISNLSVLSKTSSWWITHCPHLPVHTTPNTILSLLQDNKNIVRCIDALECQESVNSTPVAIRSQCHAHGHTTSIPCHSESYSTCIHQVGFQGHSQIMDNIARGSKDSLTPDFNSFNFTSGFNYCYRYLAQSGFSSWRCQL